MLIYWDANAVVAAVEDTGAVRGALWQLIGAAASSNNVILTSELTLAEVLVKSLAMLVSGSTAGEAAEIAASPHVGLLTRTRGIEMVPVDRRILLLAAYQRALTKSIKLPDAIHLATAEARGCTHFVTNDRKLSQIARFNCISLDTPALLRLSEQIT